MTAPDPAPLWPTGVDPARWLLGACSAGDPLRAAVEAVCGEVVALRAVAEAGRKWQEQSADPDREMALRRRLHALAAPFSATTQRTDS